jgi:hypothetical protein
MSLVIIIHIYNRGFLAQSGFKSRLVRQLPTLTQDAMQTVSEEYVSGYTYELGFAHAIPKGKPQDSSLARSCAQSRNSNAVHAL